MADTMDVHIETSNLFERMQKGKRQLTFSKKKKAADAPKELKGYLQKKSPSLFRGWQDRFIVLKDRKLFYYKNEQLALIAQSTTGVPNSSIKAKGKAKGVINFDLAGFEGPIV